MPLNKAQSEAVEYLDGPLLVLAGPGTGKTQLLSAKVARILEVTDALPDNILCLTFTEAAAANMRARLSTQIGQAANKVNIFTYHSFGNFLLSEYQNFNPEIPRFFENSINPVMSYRFVKNLQEKMEPWNALKKAEIGDLLDTIAAVKTARLTADDLAKIHAQNVEITEKIDREVVSLLNNVPPRAKFEIGIRAYQEILEKLAEISGDYQNTKQIPPLSQILFQDLQLAFAKISPEKPSIKPFSDWKRMFFIKDEIGWYKLKFDVANKKLEALYNLIIAYSDEIVKHNLYDFSDMIEEAIKALATDASFRATLSERFQYILLDEFQDTNPSQFELVKLLTDYDKPQIMAVGDDDQAIFEFQGASASNFQTFHRHFQAHVITLTENYRSTKEVLNLSEKIAEQISDRFSTLNHFDKHLRSFLSEKVLSGQTDVNEAIPKTEISRHEFISSDAEYFWVTAKVKELVDQGVPPAEIAIIAPKHKFIAPILPFFQRFPEIPLSYEKRDNLFEDPAIKEIIILTDFIRSVALNILPSYPILQILSLPSLQISPQSAVLAASDLKKTKRNLALELSEFDDEMVTGFAKKILTLATLYFSEPLESFLNELIEGLGVLNYYTDQKTNKAKTFEFYENLITLSEQVREYYAGETLVKAEKILSFREDYELAGQPLMNGSPYKNPENAVQLLSVHKSKGLEFSQVFLISVDDHAWGNAKGNNNKLVLPPNLKSIRHTGNTEDERLRLFFVAITRAKTHLYITNSMANFTGKNLLRLEYLSEFPAADDKEMICSPFVPSGKVLRHTETPEKNTDLISRWSRTYDINQPTIKDLLKFRLKNFRLSATSFTDFFDIAYAGPQVFYERHVLPSLKLPASEDQIYGTLIHKVLDEITRKELPKEQAVVIYLDYLADMEVTENTKQNLKLRGEKSLELIYRDFEKIIIDKNSLSEVSLAAQKIYLDEVPITGVIDHVSLDQQNKILEIYDYKTGKFYPEKWHQNTTLFKYQAQLFFYKILLNRAPNFSKYKIERGHILFVSPDENLELHLKALDFTEEDEEVMTKLIKKIYQIVSDLSFLECPEIYIPPNKNANICQIRHFIEKILDL